MREASSNSGTAARCLSGQGAVLDVERLGRTIDAQRRRLLQAQAIIDAVAKVLIETVESEPGEPDYALALSAASEVLGHAVDQLEPLCLGLGVPRP